MLQVFKEVSDDFNYPSMNRRDLMSNLQQCQKDVTMFKQTWQEENANKDRKYRSTSLFTGDIDGANCTLKGYKYTNKPSFINKCDDIIDKKKAAIIRESTFLHHSKMAGNKPQQSKFKTKRCTNPIVPTYEIPSYEKVEPLETKFIKDPLEINDIEGTRAKKDKWLGYERNVNPYTEVEGSRPRIQKLYKNKICNLQVKDITKKDWATGRNTSPLDPKYYVRVEENKGPEEYGKIQGAQCAELVPKNPKRELDFNLKTQDIKGAQADYCLNEPLHLKTRSQFRKINNTADIPGGQPGTLQKHIKTNRMTNPVWPKYQYPGNSEDIEFYNNQFTTSENEMKLHQSLMKSNNKNQSEVRQSLPQIPSQNQQSDKPVNVNKTMDRKRSYRSHTSHQSGQSNRSKASVAQQLDSFIKRA